MYNSFIASNQYDQKESAYVRSFIRSKIEIRLWPRTLERLLFRKASEKETVISEDES